MKSRKAFPSKILPIIFMVLLVFPLKTTAGEEENFENRLTYWTLPPSSRIEHVDHSRALVFAEPGYAWWGISVKDFHLQFRYRHGEGSGEIIVRASGEPPNVQSILIRLTNNEIYALRRIGEREEVLGTADVNFRESQWYAIAVRMIGPLIEVSVDDALILAGGDARLIPSGKIGFGCLYGSGFAYDDVVLRHMDPSQPWWNKQGHHAFEGFDEDTLEGWYLSDGARLEKRDDGHVLALYRNAHAIWKSKRIDNGRIEFRYHTRNGTGRIALRQSEEPHAHYAYVLHVEPDKVILVRESNEQVSVLAETSIEIRDNTWHDFVIQLNRGHIRIVLDGEGLVETFDEIGTLPSGVITFGSNSGGVIAFDDIRLTLFGLGSPPLPSPPTPEPPAEHFQLPPDDSYWQPIPWPGKYEMVNVVPLEVKPAIGKKRPAPINAGLVPPNFVHAWGIDIKGITKFKLEFKSADEARLHWGSEGDRLTVINANGNVLQTFSSINDLEQKWITIPSSVGYQRIYLILETSNKIQYRRFGMVGFLNLQSSTGAEEALLVGDDLNYSLPGPILYAQDTSGKPKPLYAPWRSDSPGVTINQPVPDEPKLSDGWYLVGKNTTDPERGFYTLLYYNERKGRLRGYLYNENLSSNVSGYTVTIGLSMRKGKDYVPVLGPLFPLDIRPQRWSTSRVLLPPWQLKSWTYFEVPMLYPMAEKLPTKSSSKPLGQYYSLYEDAFEEGLRNIRLTVTVQGFLKGSLQGDIIGQALGSAIQTLENKGASLSQAAEWGAELFSAGKDWYAAGKTLYGEIDDWRDAKLKELTKKYNDEQTALAALNGLDGLLAAGSSPWAAAVAAVGVGIKMYKLFFTDPEPLQLAIELALRAKIAGSVYIPLSPLQHQFYLPGRFAIQEAAAGGFPVWDTQRMDAELPRYDRTMGLFGYYSNPTELKMRVFREDFHINDDGNAIPDWWCSMQIPSYKSPPGAEKYSAYKGSQYLDQALPVIFNSYAEIQLMKPILKIVKTSAKKEIGQRKMHEQWFSFLYDISWKTHVKPEPDDKNFPKTVETDKGPRAYVKVFSDAEQVGFDYMKGGWWGIGVPNGIWLEIVLDTKYVPTSYRSYTTIRKLPTHYSYYASFILATARKGKTLFKSDDPFPLHDVIYYWDIPYFYYARTRKDSGVVPSSREITSLYSPVIIDVTRVKYDLELKATEKNHKPLKSRLLIY